MNEARPQETLEARLSWVSHPARREPVKAVLAMLVAIAMAIAVFGWAGMWLGVLSFVVVVISVQGFLFPSRYLISEDGVRVETYFGAQQRPWTSLRRADAGRYGVHLSPFSTRSWMDATRGIYIRFDDNRDLVIETVHERIAAAHGKSAASSETTVADVPSNAAGTTAVEGGTG